MIDEEGNEDLGRSPECGAIFMCNTRTKRECLKRRILGLPSSFASFVKQVKRGMILFLFEYEKRELHGVFKACSNGATDIVPQAFQSSGKRFPAQVKFTLISWCDPLSECEFRDVIRENYWSTKKFHFGLSKEQVRKLLSLFSLRELKVQSPRRRRIERPIRDTMHRAEKMTLDGDRFASCDDVMDLHGAKNARFIPSEFGGYSYNRSRRSLSEVNPTPRDVMEGDPAHAVLNDNLEEMMSNARRLVVLDDNLEETMGRARTLPGTGIFSANCTTGYSPKVQGNLGSLVKNEAAQCPEGNCERSDTCQLLTEDNLRDNCIAGSGLQPASYSHRPFLYPDSSAAEADNTLLHNQVKHAHCHSVQPQMSGIYYSEPHGGLTSVSSIPCYTGAPRVNYKSRTPTGINNSPDLGSLGALHYDLDSGFSYKDSLPAQDHYRCCSSIPDISSLRDAHLKSGGQMIFEGERYKNLSDPKFTSSAVLYPGSMFPIRGNGGQTLNSMEAGKNITFEYTGNSLGGSDRQAESEALGGDYSMSNDGHCLRDCDHPQLLQQYQSNSPRYYDEYTRNPEGICFGNQKKRSSIFTRLSLAPDVDEQEHCHFHFGTDSNMHTSKGKVMTTSSQRCKKVVKTKLKPFTRPDKELHINRKQAMSKLMLQMAALEKVSKKCEKSAGHLDERNQDCDDEESPSTNFQQGSVNLKINAFHAVEENGGQSTDVVPFIDFKRRSQSRKVRDISETKDCERTEVLLGGQHKRRKLVRPKFGKHKTFNDGRVSDDKTFDEVRDTDEGKDCEKSEALLSGPHKRTKIVRPKFVKNETSNDVRVIDDKPLTTLSLSSLEGFLDNETSGNSQGSLGIEVNENHLDQSINETHGFVDNNTNERTVVSTCLAAGNLVEYEEDRTTDDRKEASTCAATRNLVECGEDSSNKSEVTEASLGNAAAEGEKTFSKLGYCQALPSSFKDEYQNTDDGSENPDLVDNCYQDVPSSFILKDEYQNTDKESEKFDLVYNGCQDVAFSFSPKDENQNTDKRSENPDVENKSFQSFSISWCRAVPGSPQRYHKDNTAGDASHIKSDKKEDSDVDKSGKIGNNISICKAGNLISEYCGNNLTSSVEGEYEELLQLSLGSGPRVQKRSDHILEISSASQNVVEDFRDKDEEILQLSL